MAIIAAVGRALPDHYYNQRELTAALRELWGERHHNAARLDAIHGHTMVAGRHLALPLERYRGLTSFTETNDIYVECATELGARALSTALATAGRAPADIDHLFFVSTTGVATPSIDARLVNRLRLRPDVKRSPLFGLGCAGGAAAVARAADYLAAHPTQCAAVVSVELCSLTMQRHDLSVANLIASGLFGDGAAAVLLDGAAGAALGPEVLDSRSCFYPDTERAMGWDIGAEGLKLVLSAEVPGLVERHLRGDVDAFLATHGLTRAQLGVYVCHPGGPRVLEALERALRPPPGALELTWRTLNELGNLSSASVLMVLGETLASRTRTGSTPGLMMAMGPGFCSELVLLRW